MSVVTVVCLHVTFVFFFFFNDTATTEIYTLSLHDALPICGEERPRLECDRSHDVVHERHPSRRHSSPREWRLSSQVPARPPPWFAARVSFDFLSTLLD